MVNREAADAYLYKYIKDTTKVTAKHRGIRYSQGNI
jgi:hypothetical protein